MTTSDLDTEDEVRWTSLGCGLCESGTVNGRLSFLEASGAMMFR